MGITLIIIAVLVVLALWLVSIYNNCVKLKNQGEEAYAQIDAHLKQRYDLIPNLVAVVKDYAEYEQGTILAVTEARAKAAATTVNTENFDENEMKAFDAAQEELGKSMNRLLVSIENYPDLKASENYLTLQAQLEGCENRILTERERFNEAAKVYNQSLRRFPTNLLAKMFGFEKRAYFEADAGAEKVPETF
jgi:LemA protein